MLVWTVSLAALHAQFSTVSLMRIYIGLLTTLLYGAFLIPLVSSELHCSRKPYQSSISLREPENIIVAYRAIQIFQNKLNNLMGKFILPAQTVITGIFILASYMIVRYRPLMTNIQLGIFVVWMIGIPSIWVLILSIFSNTNFTGKKVLDSWKRATWNSKRERVLMSKFRASCTPIRVCWGTTYIVRKVSLMVFYRSLTRGLVRCLLAIDKTTGVVN